MGPLGERQVSGFGELETPILFTRTLGVWTVGRATVDGSGVRAEVDDAARHQPHQGRTAVVEQDVGRPDARLAACSSRRNRMKAYVITTGVVFAALVIAHVARLVAEGLR